MKTVISAVLFATLASPAMAQSDYYVCQIDSATHYVGEMIDFDRSMAAQQTYLNFDFSLLVEEVEDGIFGPEGVFFHDRALENGDHVFTEINADLELMVTIQMASVSESDWIVARGACE